jgi:hypothetical protein
VLWQARRSEAVAFDLIASNRRACIDHCDELLFDVATLAGMPCPTIERLCEKFYDGPRFTADESKALASELRALHQVMMATPEIIQLAWEARPEAYRKNYARPSSGALEAKCMELVEVCEDGARSAEGLRSLSD